MKPRSAYSDLPFILIILFLAFASVASYFRITKQNVASRLVLHTTQVKFKLLEVLNYIRDVEKKDQAIVRKADSVFYASYRLDSGEAMRKLNELDDLTKADEDHSDRKKQLSVLSGKWLGNLREEHEKAARVHGDLTTYVMQSETLLNRIRLLIIELRNAEDDLLLQKIQEKDRAAFLNPLYSLILSFLAILFVTGAYFKLRSETRLRMKAEDGRAVIHNFFQQAPAMLAILKGPEHVFEFANTAYQDLIGGRNPINKPVRAIIPEVEGQGYYEILDSVYKTGIPYIGKESPLEINRGRGIEKLYINFIYQALKNNAGETDGILVFCYDVSDLVVARNRVEEAENRTRLAVEAARLGTFDWDLQNQQFISSERLYDIFGYPSHLNHNHQDLIERLHLDDKPLRDRALQESFASGALSYEARIVWPDESIHWIRVYGKILSDDKQNILRMYGTAADITAEKIALEELRESESKFRILANTMAQQIWTADKNGSLNYFNEAVYTFSGLDYDQIKHDGWLNIVHPDDQQENIRRWSSAILNGTEFILEHRFRNVSGEYRWQLSRAVPQKDAEGNIQMWIGTSTDIQDQKHFMQELERKVFERTQSLNYANIALRQSVIELEQSNAELASFNYIASHDLQEPLRKIIAFSKRIEDLDNQNLSAGSKDYFSRIILAAARMQNLIDAFLSYSQNSNIKDAFEPCDLTIVFQEIKHECADLIEQKKIILRSLVLPTVTGIPLQIHQLFTNLIGNAMKYTRPGIIPEIDLSAEQAAGKDLSFEGAIQDQSYWKVSIRDNGIGFDQVHGTQIFELFQRLHSRQEYAGTGIGLAICKKIMRNHKGFISATGKTESGATFSMYFPVLFKS